MWRNGRPYEERIYSHGHMKKDSIGEYMCVFSKSVRSPFVSIGGKLRVMAYCSMKLHVCFFVDPIWIKCTKFILSSYFVYMWYCKSTKTNNFSWFN